MSALLLQAELEPVCTVLENVAGLVAVDVAIEVVDEMVEVAGGHCQSGLLYSRRPRLLAAPCSRRFCTGGRLLLPTLVSQLAQRGVMYA